MTEYTDEELAHAIHVAAYDRMGSIGINHDTSEAQDEIHVTVLYDLREILEHLPAKGEPAEEWEPCTFSDIRKGDRVKRVTPLIGDGTETIEGTAVTVDESWALTKGGTVLAHSRDINKPGITLHRIPAPVVAPDPAEHPVIYVKDCDLVNFIPKIMVWYRDSYVAGRQCLSPERITDWQPIDPAKVVADND